MEKFYEQKLTNEGRYLQNSVKNISIEKLANKDLKQEKGDKNVETISPNKTTKYKIDDFTLKQLFMSFFLAEKDKQPEIALLMASILDYSLDVIFYNLFNIRILIEEFIIMNYKNFIIFNFLRLFTFKIYVFTKIKMV